MRVVVVGGGHNGLVAACYLSGAGAGTLVLEQSDELGGGSRTDEPIPGHRVNTHAAAHDINQRRLRVRLGVPRHPGALFGLWQAFYHQVGASPVDPVTGVELDTGEHLDADAVLTALDPRTALLTLLDPPLSGALIRASVR